MVLDRLARNFAIMRTLLFLGLSSGNNAREPREHRRSSAGPNANARQIPAASPA